jgi:hypothetical protein
MFYDRRDYHAVLFGGDAFASEKALTRLFLANELDLKSPKLLADNYQIVYRATVVSDIPYVRVPTAREAISVRRRGKEVFQFDCYAIVYKGSPGLCLFALPFLGLLKEVLGSAIENARGDIPFQAVKLDELVVAVLSGEHIGGKLKVRALDFDVSGDEHVKRLMFRGPDTLYSKTYDRTVKGLKGITLSPRACSMTYDDYAGSRVTLEADRFGNYAFRVSAEALNVPRLRLLVSFLVEHELLKITHIVPTRRLLEDNQA